jgi:AAA family ATP:ADP antiporter
MSTPPMDDSPAPPPPARAGELGAIVAGATAFFFFMGGYYILRALREEIGARDADNLQLLWTGTFFATLLAAPLYAAIVARFARGVFIPIVFRFFIANIVIFWALDQWVPEAGQIWVGRAFYIWISVFNLFGIAVLWGFMADVFTNEQGKRLFGYLAFGATLGGILGPLLAGFLLEPPAFLRLPALPPVHLLLVAALGLEGTCQGVRLLNRFARHLDHGTGGGPGDDASAPVPGGMLAALAEIGRSPYLLTVCLYLFLQTLVATFVYFEQAHIAREAFDDRAARTAFFNNLNLAVNSIAAVFQIFLTAQVIRRLGVAITLMLVPTVCALGFLGLGTMPTLAVLVAFQVARRSMNFGFGKPAREVLFTVVDRRAKYQAKGIIDTCVYRGGDLVSGWLFAGLKAAGMSLPAIALLGVPVAGAWALVGRWLGRREEILSRAN